MFLAVVIAVLLLAVTVLVTVIILRPPATTTAPPPSQATGRAAEATTTPPPTSTATSTTSVAPPVAPSGETWTPAWPQLKQITLPGGFGDYYGASFDTPRVVRDMYVGTDLSYQSGSLNFSSNLVSTGPATLPAPEACSYAAQNQAIGKLKLVPGKTAWCIVTGRGSLVWLHLLSSEDSAFPTLTFELMRWEKTS